MIFARSEYVPGPGGTNVALGLVVTGPNAPVPRSNWYVNPAAVSACDGSNGFVSETVDGWPGMSGGVRPIVAVGFTLLIVIVVVDSVNPPSLSMTRARTTRVPGPSSRKLAGTVAVALAGDPA